MTIDDKISKLKLEIKIAENALKEKATDVAELDYVHLIQGLGSNLLSPVKDGIQPSSLSSLIPPQLNKKYGFIFRLIQRVISLMR